VYNAQQDHVYRFVSNVEDEVDVRAVNVVFEKLQRFLLHDLEYCLGKNTRDAIMEEYLGAALV
jgi:hypothetical protein